jgi:hypothetical protein
MTIGHGDEPGEAETIHRATGFATKKRRIILMLLGYSAILGVLSCFLPQEERPMDALVALPLLILGITWCFLDAEERGFRIGGFLKLLLVLLFFVGFPAYVLQSRGLGGFRTLASVLLLFGAMVLCVLATALVTSFLIP